LQDRRSPVSPVLCICGQPEMDFEDVAEEFLDEVNYCNYRRRRRTVSEAEPHDLWPPADFFRHRSGDRTSIKPRSGRSASPANVYSNGENGSRPKSKKVSDWLTSRRRADDADLELGEPAAETEFRRRAGSHGIRDLLRIRPRCYSHGEKGGDGESLVATPGRGGNGASLSPGSAAGTNLAGTSANVSRFRVFLEAFRHRAHSESLSISQTPIQGLPSFLY